MSYSGINQENIKFSNRSAILKLLNDRGSMSRKDIAVELGLTPATVSLISADLLATGILLEHGEMLEEKRAGRKKVSIGINYQYKYVLSISIESPETCIVISDMKGQHIAEKRIKTDIDSAPEAFLKHIADESKALMWEQEIGKESVLGVGISVPGPVNRENGVSIHAYRIWNEAVPVGTYMKDFLNMPIIVENNVKAFAEAEQIYGTGKKQDNMLFIKWGPGVGSAIMIENKIYDSKNSKTAEIGHVIIENNGSLCRCGRKGCLETHVATHAIVNQVRNSCNAQTMPKLYTFVQGDVDKVDTKNMEQWITFEDALLQKTIDEIVECLARVVVNTITILAPDKVIIYGKMFDLACIEKRFLKFCANYEPAYDEKYILKSELSDRIHYIGPLAVAVNELFLGE